MVAGGHNTTTPYSRNYPPMVSWDSVSKDNFKNSAFKYLKVIACDIQNTYLTEKCHEKIWTMSGP